MSLEMTSEQTSVKDFTSCRQAQVGKYREGVIAYTGHSFF